MKGRRGVVALPLLLALAAALPVAIRPAGAQTAADKEKVDAKIGSVQRQVDTASAEEQRLLGLIAESKKRKGELDAKVATFDGQIAGVQRQLDAAESRLSALEAQQRAVEDRLVESRAALAAAKEELGRQAIAAYTGRSEAASYAAMLLGASNLGDVASRRSYMRAVVGSQSETIATTEALRDQVGDLAKLVEASRTEAQGQRDLIASQRSRLQASRDAQATARREVQGEISRTDRLRDEVLSRKEEFEGQVANLERESAAIAETLRARAAAGARAPGRLLMPVPGAPVTSPFGPRVHPIYGTLRAHTGIDYGADTGTPIRAAGDGVVVSASWFGGYGNATIIDHGGGLATLYGHQSSMSVAGGERVTAGQVIGRVGCTGNCTGPHLHFEARANGDPVNPANYL